MLPTVSIQANGTIFNGEFCLSGNGFMDEDNRLIVDTCKLTLDRLGVALLFRKNAITTFVEDAQRLRQGRYGWLNHLVNFIIYKSRVNYCGYCNWLVDDAISFDTCSEVDRVLTFNLERLTEEQGIKKIGDRFVCLGSEPYRLEIEREEFDNFDKLIDRSLAVAITYFLVASDNPQYFLVEYYKCLEVIKHEFASEAKMLGALGPHGFNKAMFKTLTMDANNHRMPIAFGRHAPKSGADAIGIDLRALRAPTMQRELFVESTQRCRACIDAYTCYLLQHAQSARAERCD